MKLSIKTNLESPAGRWTRGGRVAALAAALWLGGAVLAVADSLTWNSGFADGGLIPDGTSAGWADSRTVSGLSFTSITNVSVSLTIRGGWNGDYYAYLTHGSGFSVLLNRVGRTASDGFGYSDTGLNVTLDDHAVNGDIHLYQNVSGYATFLASGGVFQPDGRNVNPLTVKDTDAPTLRLDQFDGLDPNGAWTLFIADLSSGEQGTVAAWSLELNGVPEPGPIQVMALGLATWAGWRHARRQRMQS